MTQFVVIFGTLSDGIQSTHGPFRTKELAEEWIRIVSSEDQPHTIQRLSFVHEGNGGGG